MTFWQAYVWYLKILGKALACMVVPAAIGVGIGYLSVDHPWLAIAMVPLLAGLIAVMAWRLSRNLQ